MLQFLKDRRIKRIIHKNVKKGRIVVIVGHSASGKTTLAQKLGCRNLVTHTSRPMRDGEVDGIDYHFVDQNTITKLPSVSFRIYNTVFGSWIYSLTEKELEEPGIVVLDYPGYLMVKKWALDNQKPAPLLIYCEVPQLVAMKRAQNRGNYNPEEFLRRWYKDSSDMGTARLNAHYIYKSDK